MTQHIFLVGAKSLGAYGGYETFVNKLTEYHQFDNRLKYHVACKANGDGCMDETKLKNVSQVKTNKKGEIIEFSYHNAHCFKIRVPNIGAAQAIYYDLKALSQCCNYIIKNQIPHPIIYIMACRIGPFITYFEKKVHKLGGKIFLNPDGHEWMRSKWNKIIRKYWKESEKLMVLHSDLIICDSINIEKYIHKTYDAKERKVNTTFIAYGAETRKSSLADDDSIFQNWIKKNEIKINNYYLVVGRFVPENNYEIMIKEFMKSHTKKDFVIITNVNDKLLSKLEERLRFKKDKRIKFVGTVYDQELLMKIRENAYGYFHGHEVGGTNPSLLEALGSTNLNLLLEVGFNKEVAQKAALYWNKQEGNLSKLIERADGFTEQEIIKLGEKAKNRVREAYSWKYICERYAEEFLKNI